MRPLTALLSTHQTIPIAHGKAQFMFGQPLPRSLYKGGGFDYLNKKTYVCATHCQTQI